MPTWTPERSTLIDLGGRSVRQVGGPTFVPQEVSIDARPSGLLLGAHRSSVSATVGGGWGDGAAMGSRPVRATPIVINGQNNVTVYNHNFNGVTHGVFQYDGVPPGNSHVCIRVLNSTNVTIMNCDFTEVSEPIEVYNSSNVEVRYCRVNGITGPGERVNEQTGNFLQTHGGTHHVWVHHNKVIAMGSYDPWSGGHTMGPEDVISFFGASFCIAEYNNIDATGYERAWGTGTILGDGGGSDNIIRYNTYLNPGQVGIAVAGGRRNHMIGNTIYRQSGQVLGSGNTAAYYWDYAHTGTMSDGVVQNNRAKWHQGGGFFNSGPPPAAVSGNNWDDNTLNPADLAVVL